MTVKEEIYTSQRKPRKCPNCGSKRLAGIIFGPSHVYPDMNEEILEGKVVVRPCCTKGPVASWECLYCGAQIYRESEMLELSLF